MLKEFREFAMRGNVVDLAVGVVIGAAFGKIVTALVDNIIMPLIGLMTGGLDFKSLAVKVKDSEIKYGLFLQNVIDFIIIAFAIFLMIKTINRMQRPKQEPETASTMKDCPFCLSSVPLLATRCSQCTSELPATG
jgi:large conductance mechanosensitive channel